MVNNIYNQDCLEGMKNILDGSIDMILCDLPYGTTACKWDVIIPFEPLWEQYERVIKDNGAIVLTASQPFTSSVIMSKRELFRYEIIWDKVRSATGLNATRMPLKTHENILVFYKTSPTYNPQKTVGNPFDKTKYNGRISIENVTGGGIENRVKNNGDRFPVSIQKFSQNWARQQQLHPTQKPVALFEYLIKTYTNEGETVLDNCMGSGTTAIACINTNRNYIGFEKEEKYYKIIQERIKKHSPQFKLAI